MRAEVDGQIIYTLPDSITADNYKLLIQKQSGAGDVPIAVHVKTNTDEYSIPQQILKNDLRFEYSK